jgi:hypothetical protein
MMMDSPCVVSLSGRRKISEKKKKRLSPFCVVDMQEEDEEKGFLACIGNARRQSILAGVFL